jgi:hypothetical protein
MILDARPGSKPYLAGKGRGTCTPVTEAGSVDPASLTLAPPWTSNYFDVIPAGTLELVVDSADVAAKWKRHREEVLAGLRNGKITFPQHPDRWQDAVNKLADACTIRDVGEVRFGQWKRTGGADSTAVSCRRGRATRLGHDPSSTTPHVIAATHTTAAV